MSENKHTPGPYIAQKTDHEYIIVAPDMINSSQTGNPLACMDLRTYCHVGDKQMGIDAEFIVQACNSHAALLEACKEAFGVLTEPGIMAVDKWKGWRKLTVAKLREAIEQAEKGSE